MNREHGVHPAAAFTARVYLPPNVVVCPCGLHHMVKGQRIDRAFCERLRMGSML